MKKNAIHMLCLLLCTTLLLSLLSPIAAAATGTSPQQSPVTEEAVPEETVESAEDGNASIQDKNGDVAEPQLEDPTENAAGEAVTATETLPEEFTQVPSGEDVESTSVENPENDEAFTFQEESRDPEPLSDNIIITSGTCGDNLFWTFDEETGTLTISGSGAMEDYYSNSYLLETPWNGIKHLITKVVLSDGVTSIGANAFDWCKRLKSIVIPSSVTTIERYAFHCCTSLTDIVIPDSVTSIGEAAFNDCTGLKSIVLSKGITEISGWMFQKCNNLSNITIPNSVKKINNHVFNGCTNLKTVILPEGLEEIGVAAFERSGVANITIPNSVTSIGANAFYACHNLANITIPCNVNSIGEKPFTECSGLNGIWVDERNTYYSSDSSGVLYNNSGTSLIAAPAKIQGEYSISKTVEQICDGAFYDCRYLTGISIPETTSYIGAFAFYNCEMLSEVTVPGSAKIEAYAFNNCVNLTRVTLLDGICHIGLGAFANCEKLSSITFPQSIDWLGFTSFSNCSNLARIKFEGSVPGRLLAGNLFENVTATAYYPADNETWTEDVMLDYGGKITWVPYSQEEKSGDVSGDGKVNAIDAAQIYAVVNNKKTLTDAEFKAADVDGDGKVLAKDAAMVYAYANNRLNKFPSQK